MEEAVEHDHNHHDGHHHEEQHHEQQHNNHHDGTVSHEANPHPQKKGLSEEGFFGKFVSLALLSPNGSPTWLTHDKGAKADACDPQGCLRAGEHC